MDPDFILAQLIALHLRTYTDWDATGPLWTPPLTTAEQAILADLRLMSNLGVQTLTLAEFRARKADVADIKAQLTALAQWLALPTGTAKTANAIAAEQAIGTALTELARVVQALLKVTLT